MEIPWSLSCCLVLTGICKRLIPYKIQKNPNFSLFHGLQLEKGFSISGQFMLLTLKCKFLLPCSRSDLIPFSINLYSSRMWKQQIVCNNVGFCHRISCCMVPKWSKAPSTSKNSIFITKSSNNPWLIECHPVFHPVTKFFEAELWKLCIFIPMQQKMICMSLLLPWKVSEVGNYEMGFELHVL